MSIEKLREALNASINEAIPRGYEKFLSEGELKKNIQIVFDGLNTGCMAYCPQKDLFIANNFAVEITPAELSELNNEIILDENFFSKHNSFQLNTANVIGVIPKICTDGRWAFNSSIRNLNRDVNLILDKENQYLQWRESRVVDGKQHIILEQYGADALVYLPENTVTHYVVARDYDRHSGEWAYGTYFNDLGNAYNYINPNILEDCCIVPTKQDLMLLLIDEGFEPTSNNLTEIFFANSDITFDLRVELKSKLNELFKEYIHNAKDFLTPKDCPVSLSDKQKELSASYSKQTTINKEEPVFSCIEH